MTKTPSHGRRRSAAVVAVGAVLMVLIFALLAGSVLDAEKSLTKSDPTSPTDTTGTPDMGDTTPEASTARVPDGATGFSVVRGSNENAKATITIYEDFHCPICAGLEQYAGADLARLADEGLIRVEHHPVAILNDHSTNFYSTRAANAYAAVLHTAGAKKADRFRTLLYINQPTEGQDGLTDSDLVQIAVMAGAEAKQVRPLIRDAAFLDWVEEGTRVAFEEGHKSTPDVFLNGKKVNPFSGKLPRLISKAVGQPIN